MNRVVTLIVVVAVLAGTVPAAASLADQTASEENQPGATFAGVVGIQRAEVGNEVAQRSLDQRLAAAETNASKAKVVASESTQLESRLNRLEERKQRLETAYDNGSISRGEYRARLAPLAAELRSIERRANQTAAVATDLPDEELRETGASPNTVRAVAKRANEVGGGAVAEAATSVAGKSVGAGLGDDRRGRNSNPGAADKRNGRVGNDRGKSDAVKPGRANRTDAVDGVGIPPVANRTDNGNGADSDKRGKRRAAGNSSGKGKNASQRAPDARGAVDRARDSVAESRNGTTDVRIGSPTKGENRRSSNGNANESRQNGNNASGNARGNGRGNGNSNGNGHGNGQTATDEGTDESGFVDSPPVFLTGIGR